jgi:NIPSNAP
VFFELREYRTHPGQRDNWVRFMEEQIIPFQVSKGMVIVGSFTGQEEDDLYIWVRRFEDDAERDRLYESVYQSDHWKTNIAPKIPEMMDRTRMVVRRIEATPRSVVQ